MLLALMLYRKQNANDDFYGSKIMISMLEMKTTKKIWNAELDEVMNEVDTLSQ